MFQDNIFFPRWMDCRNNVYKYQLEWLIPIGLGGLGAWAGSRGGGDVTTTTQMIPPPLTTQQQILINQMADWLYQAAPQYQGYINQTLQSIYGGVPSTPTIGEGYMGEKVPGQLTGELGEEYETAVQTEASYQRQMESYEGAKKRTDLYNAYNRLLKDPYWSKVAETGNYPSDWYKPGNPLSDYMALVQPAWGEIAKTNALPETANALEWAKEAFHRTMKTEHDLSDIEADIQFEIYQRDPEVFTADYLGPEPVKPGEALEPTPELVTPSKGTAPTEAEAPWSPFAEIMSWTPEKIAEYYGIERTKQQREIEDWYGQAQREASQRGISQYGGYEGSGTARDVALLAAEKARMSTSLGESMRQMQLAHEMQQPYEMLSAAQGLIGTMAGLQQPWLQLGTSLASPYGPTTQISTQPGVSSTQGAVLGGLQGLGLYGATQGLGWWDSAKPATMYGAGLTGPQSWQQQGYGQSGMSSWGYGPYEGYWYPSGIGR